MENNALLDVMRADADLVNAALEAFLHTPSENLLLDRLIEAERYSIFAGGKRIRPILAIEFCRLFGGDPSAAVPFAMAVEMVHTASLIHDDMPAIDDDELRRGRPTSHTVFGEATALLAGDALFMDAFSACSSNSEVEPRAVADAVRILADAVGTHGLVGGEFVDVLGESESLDLDSLLLMNRYKTGALIRAGAQLGCVAAGVAVDESRMRDAEIYADSIGMAFQIIDDILDVTGSAETLGKNPGQDARDNKTNYLSFYPIETAREHARELTERAVSAIAGYEGSDFLVSLARYLASRES